MISKKQKIILVFVIIIIIIIIIIALLKFNHKSNNDNSNHKNPIIGSPKCSKIMYSCNTDNDCKKCEETIDEGVELSCIQMEGQTGKICSLNPAIKSKCNSKMGAVNVWTAWDNPDRMEWDCFCTRPDWASAPDSLGKTVCNLNPDICKNGTFTWDTSFNVDPNPGFCFCNEGHSLYTNNDYPICVPNDTLTEYMYSSGRTYNKDKRSCTLLNNCSGNGYCNPKISILDTDECICKNGFSGKDCSIKN